MWPPRTLVITDRTRLAQGGPSIEDAAVVAFVASVARAGADAVQVRERDWDDGRLLRVVRAARAATAGTGCRLLVNDRAHVAWAAGADGVHLRADGLPARRVREAHPGTLVGRSVHADDDQREADGVDYVLFGTVFASRTKGPHAPVAGLPSLARWARQAAATPVIAVGGIDLARCPAVRTAGASGVAGIELFASAYMQGPAALAALVRDIHAVFADGERAE